MNHVLTGIIGVILFIGMALAGASYFGPRVTTSNTQAQAALVMLALTQVSNGYVVRNRELEVTTPATVAYTSLIPTYMPELPSNLGGTLYVVDQNGTQTGAASYAFLKIQRNNAAQICGEISKQTGGSAVVTALPSPITRPMGCGTAPYAIGSFIAQGDAIAYAAID